MKKISMNTSNDRHSRCNPFFNVLRAFCILGAALPVNSIRVTMGDYSKHVGSLNGNLGRNKCIPEGSSIYDSWTELERMNHSGKDCWEGRVMSLYCPSFSLTYNHSDPSDYASYSDSFDSYNAETSGQQSPMGGFCNDYSLIVEESHSPKQEFASVSGNCESGSCMDVMKNGFELDDDPYHYYKIAKQFSFGEGGHQQNNTEAVRWLKKAADRGFGLAQLELGFRYKDGGRGVPKESNKMIEYFMKAKKSGYIGVQPDRTINGTLFTNQYSITSSIQSHVKGDPIYLMTTDLNLSDVLSIFASDAEMKRSNLSGKVCLKLENGNGYEGDVENGKKDGNGTMTYENGDTYEGEWKDDIRHGKGKFTDSGGTYDGSWENNGFNGHGTLTNAEGTYVGMFKDGKKDGKGKFTDSGGTYDGSWENDKFYGHGTLTNAEGTYVGMFKDGKRHGKGTLTNAEGTYVGMFKDGNRHGKGKLTDSGGTYEGSWENNDFNGHGTLTNEEGTYIGMFKDGKKDGKGTLSYKDGTIYDGDWKYDKHDGIGVKTYNDGLTYEGKWKYGKRNGIGTMTYENGNTYEGEWKYEVINGHGTLTNDEGTYVGMYKDGKRHGKGTMTNTYSDSYKEVWADGVRVTRVPMDRKDNPDESIKSNPFLAFAIGAVGVLMLVGSSIRKYGQKPIAGDEGIYEGECENGKQNGVGVMTYKDGTKYEGDWKNGKHDGVGVKTYKDGTKYDGNWINGKQNGVGIMTYKEGTKYDGNWKNGKHDGVGVKTYKDGTKYDGDWKNGKQNGVGIMTYKDGAKYDGNWINGKQNGVGIMTYGDGTKYDGDWINGNKSENKADDEERKAAAAKEREKKAAAERERKLATEQRKAATAKDQEKIAATEKERKLVDEELKPYLKELHDWFKDKSLTVKEDIEKKDIENKIAGLTKIDNKYKKTLRRMGVLKGEIRRRLEEDRCAEEERRAVWSEAKREAEQLKAAAAEVKREAEQLKAAAAEVKREAKQLKAAAAEAQNDLIRQIHENTINIQKILFSKETIVDTAMQSVLYAGAYLKLTELEAMGLASRKVEKDRNKMAHDTSQSIILKSEKGVKTVDKVLDENSLKQCIADATEDADEKGKLAFLTDTFQVMASAYMEKCRGKIVEGDLTLKEILLNQCNPIEILAMLSVNWMIQILIEKQRDEIEERTGERPKESQKEYNQRHLRNEIHEPLFADTTMEMLAEEIMEQTKKQQYWDLRSVQMPQNKELGGGTGSSEDEKHAASENPQEAGEKDRFKLSVAAQPFAPVQITSEQLERLVVKRKEHNNHNKQN